MCERYVIPDQDDVEREFRLAKPWWKFSASFNVSAARNVPVIRLHQKESEGVMMRWGFIPQWAKGEVAKKSYLHARAKELDTSEVFRFAWRNSQRCILPLAGFYEWQLTASRYRQPYFVRLVNRTVFGLAGIWDRWVNEDDDDVIESCALIIVPSNPLMAEIHNTEPFMPAILRREDYQAWLTGGPGPTKKLLRTYPQDRMVTHAVSPRINSLKFDDPSLIEPTRAEFATQVE